ncbi:MAG: L-lactate permease [Promethearchaeota archaeon]
MSPFEKPYGKNICKNRVFPIITLLGCVPIFQDIIAANPLLGCFFILLPIIIAFYLLAGRRWSADKTGIVAFVVGIVIAILCFGTNPLLAILASIGGIIASFPISLMVVTSILMITYMVRSGSLARITVFFKTLGSGNKPMQIMLINVGLGLFLVGLGATPVSMLPPVMLAMGYSPLVAVALPAIGYDPLTTYALLGIPALVFADTVGLVDPTYWSTHYPGAEPFYMSGHIFSIFMPVVATGIALAMLWIAGGRKLLFNREALALAILAGITAGGVCILCNLPWVGFTPLTNVFAGLAVIGVMLAYAKLRGLPLIDRSMLTEEDQPIIQSMSLIRALSPWIILIIFCFATNLIPIVYDLLFRQLTFPIIIGRIQIRTRVFWNAYFWVLIATLLAIPFLPHSRPILKDTFKTWAHRTWRPFVSAAIFFALAFIIIYSGSILATDGSWILPSDPTHPHPEWNMVYVLAHVTSGTFGPLYPITAAFLGLLGGFVSGSETSSITMFQPYHQLTSELIGANPLVVGASSGIGGGLASVLSPAKLQNAAAVIDQQGIEGRVLRYAVPIALTVTIAVAFLAFFWAFLIP